ncbi:hypothetical protein BN946_scf185002.g4 [Trametes cinnabarina]|uniref:Uncharacterized protein n=1 Tax=Pycnoporus cinnabarinus TaxID=5643 RepID=A0A060SKV2_PYCCI|nr:hypothetical protein BN946_scf185002.g4 [Trametes cinnabarina]
MYVCVRMAGGGGQFGIVVEFVFRTHPYAGPFGSGIIAYPGSELESVLKVIKVSLSRFLSAGLTLIAIARLHSQEWQTTQTPADRLTISFSRPAPHFKVCMPRCLRRHRRRL